MIGDALKRWGLNLPKPRAVLVVSAHWEEKRLSHGKTTQHEKLLYDFYGFPEELYRVRYPAPGVPWMTDQLETLLGETLIKREDRCLDHGVWVPLFHMWPEADVPVYQISLPRDATDSELFDLGSALAPLRAEGVMIIASGSMTHNLAHLGWSHQKKPESWASDFDNWVVRTLEEKNREALISWEKPAPHRRLNHPTSEHFRPLLIAAGAAWEAPVHFPIYGFQFGNLSYRMVQLG